ncbi:SRP40, C-terminal domain-containing protein, partial [Trametes meyenii]
KPSGGQKNEKGGKKPRKSNTPFQRIKVDEVTYADERLKDNRFESRLAMGASSNDYGARASRDLIVTRGAGFRKEKNKKKRGSYRGGEISVRLNVHEILRIVIDIWHRWRPTVSSLPIRY